jgi:protein-disulfide isomerase
MRISTKLATIAALSALSASLLVGCKGKKNADGATSAVASASPAPSGSAAFETDIKGPCGDMVRRICTQTGEKSPACGASQTLGEILADSACEAAVKDFASTQTKLDSLKAVCDKLMNDLCRDIGEQTETCKMVRTQTPQFPPDRCQQLMKQYDKILADLKSKEAKNKPLAPELQAKLTTGTVPSFGPADAKVTVVAFSDFQCPYCSKAADVFTQLKKEYAGKSVRVLFHQFPLSFHKDAHLAAQAAMEAQAQGKFWEYHDLLFKNQRALQREHLEKYASQLGLNLGALRAALDSGKYKAAVDADMKLGEEVSVSGTPTVFINGERAANPSAFDAVKQSIDAKLGS